MARLRPFPLLSGVAVDALRAFVVRALTVAFVGLLAVDVLDDVLAGNRWAGCPTEMYPLMGAVLAGLFTAEALRKRANGNGNGNGTKGGE